MESIYPTEWYKHWFNSPYYHILYKNRDDKEAELFIDNLLNHLQLPVKAKIEDVCCGKGRHSIYLNKKGFDVTGIDLSEQSIQYASRYENTTLSFFVHDMRKTFRVNYFDAAFNLFTSFGYFESKKEEIETLISIRKGLKSNGILVIDYFNAEKILSQLVMEEIKTIDGVIFKIRKEVNKEFIIKTIEVEANSRKHFYVEKVRILNAADFEYLFDKAGFKLISIFGDYNLAPFNSRHSERLILQGIKK